MYITDWEVIVGEKIFGESKNFSPVVEVWLYSDNVWQQQTSPAARYYVSRDVSKIYGKFKRIVQLQFL